MALTRFPIETDQPVLEVTLPPGRHVLELVVEDSAGLRSAPDQVVITVENILPVIDSIEPATARQSAEGVPAIIRGTNFQDVQEVSFSGSGITVESMTVNSSEELAIVLIVAPDAPLGPQRIRVTTGDGTVESPADVTLTIERGLPVIAAIDPNRGSQGTEQLTLTISGRYLEGVESVRFTDDGIEVIEFRVIGPETLEVDVSIPPASPLGPQNYQVVTEAGTAVSPATARFTVQQGGPAISGINPDSGRQGTLSMRAVITGSGLINVLSVRFDDSQISVVDIGAQRETEVEIFITISPRATVGPHSFSVETQTGAAESPPRVVFTVFEEVRPTVGPTPTIGPIPTVGPTPTVRPIPTFDPRPTIGPIPTIIPRPTVGPIPTIAPRPTIAPTIAPRPTIAPTIAPRPTIAPTIRPTIGLPTLRPGPTFGPTFIPVSERGAAVPAEFNADDFPGRTVTEVRGIGPATAGRLENENITNLAHLASLEPGKLAEILEISEVRAMEFIDAARRLLTEEE